MDGSGMDQREAANFADDIDKKIETEAQAISWHHPTNLDIVTVEVGSGSEASTHSWVIGRGSGLEVDGVNIERCVCTMRTGEVADFKSKNKEDAVSTRLSLVELERREDLLGNGKLIRVTSKEGLGWQTPSPGTELRVRFSWRALPEQDKSTEGPSDGAKIAPSEVLIKIGGSADVFSAIRGSDELRTLRRTILRLHGGTVTLCFVAQVAAEDLERAFVVSLNGADIVSTSSLGVEGITQAIKAIEARAGELEETRYRSPREVSMSFDSKGIVCSAEDWIPNPIGLKVLSDIRNGQRCTVQVAPELAFGDEGLPVLGVPGDAFLEYDIELIQIMKLEDISLDGSRKVMKKTLKDGEGHDRPLEGSEVTMCVEVCDDASGNVLVDECTISFTAVSGKYCSAIEETALLMRAGELCQVRCSDVESCNDKLLGLNVNGSTVVLSLEMVEFTKIDITSMEEPARVAHCSNIKDVGSSFFQQGACRRALRRYQHASNVLSHLEDWKDESAKSEAANLKRVCHANAAACWLKLQNWHQAAASCDAVLREEPNNVKALFRRARAYQGLFEYVQAERVLRKLLEHNPENKEAARMLLQMREFVKIEKKKQQNMFSKMVRGIQSGDEKSSTEAPSNSQISSEIAETDKSNTPQSLLDTTIAVETENVSFDNNSSAGLARTLLVAAAAVFTVSGVAALVRKLRKF